MAKKSRFRRVIHSYPKFESEGLHLITVKSPALKGRGDITIFKPGQLPENISVVILLHGVGSSHWAWTHCAGVHRTAKKMIADKLIEPMLLVMPSDGMWGDGSGYINHEKNYEDWIIKDVVDVIKETYSCVTAKSKFFVSGFSMGGYGALLLGAKYPSFFSGMSGLASITKFDQMKRFIEEELIDFKAEKSQIPDLINVLVKNKNQLPTFRLDCPTECGLLPYNQLLHEELLKAKIPHGFEIHQGIHEWDFCEREIHRSLILFNQK
jgi:S-formylglutathione hydrolase FrmB